MIRKLLKKTLLFSLLIAAAICAYTGTLWAAYFLGGFFFGFIIALDRMFKSATGRSMDDDEFLAVVDKVL